MPRRSNTSRRNVLKTAGVGLATLSFGTTISAGEQTFEYEQHVDRFLDIITEKYGKEEAERILRIATPYLKAIEKDNMPKDVAQEKITTAILSASDTDAATQDIQEYQERKPSFDNVVTREEQEKKMSSVSSTSGITTQSTDTIRLNFGFTNRGTSAGGEAGNWVNDVDSGNNPSMGELAHGVLYGSAWSLARVTAGKYSPPSNGQYEVKLPYYLLGNTLGANTTIYLFRRDHTRGDNKKIEIRSPSGGVDSSFTDYPSLYLRSDHEYNIGFEIYGSASATGGDNFSDFYHTQADGRIRHANMRGNYIDIIPF